MSDERALERRGAVDLMQLPRLIGGALADIRTIAEGMATLPKLLVSLNSIDDRVESLNDEVKKMRAAVESMGGDVSELSTGIDRLEGHVDDVARVAHPLRRLSRRRPAPEPE
jgi:methyl-accepting chemotaxis protein